MRKVASKIVAPPRSKRGPKPRPPRKPSPDEQLADHLRQAEDHVIAAVNLFSGPRKVTRRAGYQDKLERTQEAITTLYREELVRIRGPIKNRGKK